MNGKLISRRCGFTLIELLVVMTIIATLLMIAYPKYFKSVDHSKESALREDLSIIRDALDKFYADTGNYPNTLDDLVSKGYLRAVPPDPITDSTQTWVLIPSPQTEHMGVFNIKSGAQGNAEDGKPYSEW